MKRYAIRFGLWLARWGGWTPPQCRHTGFLALGPDLVALVAAARITVAHLETLADAGGEYKRHLAYARLLKAHPGAARRDIGLAIEMALR